MNEIVENMTSGNYTFIIRCTLKTLSEIEKSQNSNNSWKQARELFIFVISNNIVFYFLSFSHYQLSFSQKFPSSVKGNKNEIEEKNYENKFIHDTNCACKFSLFLLSYLTRRKNVCNVTISLLSFGENLKRISTIKSNFLLFLRFSTSARRM